MPFGMANAPSSWQSVVNDIFRDLLAKFVVVYLDDILIYSKTKQEHENHVHEVLNRLEKHELYVKLSKSEFFVDTVEFLGHILSRHGIRPSDSKMASMNWPSPKTRKHIRQFLGLTGFFRRYIPQYAKIATPLTNLLMKGATFEWTKECETAFVLLKEKLVSPPILRIADPDRPFRIEADTSGQATGSVLLQ